MASLLILTQPIQKIIPSLPRVLSAASDHVKKRLYIHLDYLSRKQTPAGLQSLKYKSKIISKIYSESSTYCPGIDIRILMDGFKQIDTPIQTHQSLEKFLIDCISNPSDLSLLEKRYMFNDKNSSVLFNKVDYELETEIELDVLHNEEEKVYADVVAGGTFDRIHPGHKILLAEAVLRTSKRLTIGVADGPLLKRKVLKELILPCPKRLNELKEFLTDIDPHLEYNLVKIEEPMGPTSHDPNMEMIVVSKETEKGIQMINNFRKEKGLNELQGYCIELFDDSLKKYKEEEDKFSSSSQRMRLLGSRLICVEPNSNISEHPYIIGLTGGSASGKTSIGRTLKEMGAGVIDCDKLGHKSYEVGTQCYLNLIETFGKEILNEDKQINRKVLGSLVFNNKDKLKQLTDIVWPQIALLATEEIKKEAEEGKKVVILDAAVLLEAGWNQMCHEVWVSMIERDEAIRRIVERDGSTEESASRRIGSQMSNEERVSFAHIVFCSQWAFEVTRRQVQEAWQTLQAEGKV